MKKNLLEKIFDNIFDVITILVSISIIIYGQFKPFVAEDVPNLISWILTVLGLLAVSGLWDRNRRMERIEQSTKKTYDAMENSTKRTNALLESLARDRINPKDFFVLDDSEKKKILETADDIALSGITLNYISNNYLHIIEQKLSVGVNIRLLLLDTTDSNLEQMQQRGWGIADFDLYRSLLSQSIKKLEIIATKPKSKGFIEIGYLPFYPSFAIDLINISQSKATLWVSIHPMILSGSTFLKINLIYYGSLVGLSNFQKTEKKAPNKACT